MSRGPPERQDRARTLCTFPIILLSVTSRSLGGGREGCLGEGRRNRRGRRKKEGGRREGGRRGKKRVRGGKEEEGGKEGRRKEKKEGGRRKGRRKGMEREKDKDLRGEKRGSE